MEALALAPGAPTIAAQEKRDRVPGGTYQSARVVRRDRSGRRDAGPVGGDPGRCHHGAVGRGVAAIVCDRFRLAELEDAAPGWAD